MAVRCISALESKVTSIVSNCAEMVSANVKSNLAANPSPNPMFSKQGNLNGLKRLTSCYKIGVHGVLAGLGSTLT